MFEKDAPPGLKSQARRADLGHGLQRPQAKGGKVKPFVLGRLGAFHDHRAGPAKLTSAPDGCVGAFNGLDGKYDFLPYDQALADVELPQGLCQRPCELYISRSFCVGFLFVRTPSGASRSGE